MTQTPRATPAHQAAIVGFLARNGKRRYWEVKAAVGVPRKRTIMMLSRCEASRLIDQCKMLEGRR